MARRLDLMRLDDLVPADVNPKGHEADLIRASLTRFGVIEQIVLDERTGQIISGHGRRDDFIARRASGEAPPEGVEIDPESGEWMVYVTRGWHSKDDSEAIAAGIALNEVGAKGGWTDDLADVLDRLAAGSEEALRGIGFTLTDIADLQGLAAASAPSLDDLRTQHGDPDPRDFWPAFRLRCPPEVRTRFLALVGELPDDDRLAALVAMAEKGSQSG